MSTPGSGHRLHQATPRVGVVIVVAGTTLQQGDHTKAQQAEHRRDHTEAPLKVATDVNQLAHEAV